MKKIFFLCYFVFFIPITAYCEWNSIAENKEAKIFIDPGSIRRVDSGIKSIWTLKNYKNPKDEIKSRQFKLELDCEQQEFRRLIRVSFSAHFSSGLPIKDYFKSEDWRSVEGFDLFKAVFLKICSKGK